MANHKSALKRIRSNETRRISNRYFGRTMRNALKDFRAIDNKVEAEKSSKELIALIDKNAKRNIIHSNKASNLKSQIMLRVNSL